MTLNKPGCEDDVLLPLGWNTGKTDQSRLFSLEGLELHLIPGAMFSTVSDAVGTLRESTYRQQLSGSGNKRDLDGRDPYYDHLLLVETSSQTLAGAARLQFIPKATAAADLPNGQQSYLEHVYPGIKSLLTGREHHLEIGRVALAQRFQRQPHSLMALFRGGLLIASQSGYSTLHGLVSYNHFAYSDAVNERFLNALLHPPYRRSNSPLPPPRHAVQLSNTESQGRQTSNIQALELTIRDEQDDAFRLPVLLRQYINLMEAEVCDLSLAKDFNQITEILMAAELRSLPKERLHYFIDVPHQPIYQQFSWYRGEGQMSQR